MKKYEPATRRATISEEAYEYITLYSQMLNLPFNEAANIMILAHKEHYAEQMKQYNDLISEARNVLSKGWQS